MNRKLKIGVAALLVVAGAIGGAWYWLESGKVRATENAYINADIVQVASQVSGQVINIYVREGQSIKAGQPLFDIDPAPYRIALEQAEAKMAEAEQTSREDLINISAARAALAQAEADLVNTRNTLRRTHSLVRQNFLSKQVEDDLQSKMKVAEAAVAQAHAKLAGAQAHAAAVGDTRAPPAVLATRAAVEHARLDLAHTHVVASKDGWISNLSLVSGTTVSPNTPLFALIARGSFWVDANFKETELPGIHPGQMADVEIDMQPDHRYAGVVESVGNGTGAAFSLLPAQNATGNWVKVTQRVPVRIRFRAADAAQLFRVGASAYVTVHLKD